MLSPQLQRGTIYQQSIQVPASSNLPADCYFYLLVSGVNKGASLRFPMQSRLASV